MSEQNKLKYYNAIINFSKIGPARFYRLKSKLGNVKNIWQANKKELLTAQIEEKIIDEFIIYRSNTNPEQLFDELQKEEINIISIEDNDYPYLLSKIYDPPPILYFKGNIKSINQFALAVVGSRKVTTYGRQVVQDITSRLAINNLIIVSGMAYGIDTLAHQATLNNHGITIAVLGSGLKRKNIYPAANLNLMEQIIESNGVVLSEYPPNIPALPTHFPQRNRIISGLSKGVLVIEAGEKSGALITARCALEQGRDVFVIPGSIYSPMSIGANNLIKKGAILVTSAEDILEALDLKQVKQFVENKILAPKSESEKIIFALLSKEPKHINQIIKKSGLDTATVNSTLTIMEMKGMVKNLGGMQYVLI